MGSPSMMLPPSEPFRTFSTPVNSLMSFTVSSRAVPSAGCRNAGGGGTETPPEERTSDDGP